MNSLVSVAKLPVNYEAAKHAISICADIDECKDWKDRAVAIASYAAQKRDRTMLECAQRIRTRAGRKLGELIEETARATSRPLRHVIAAAKLSVGEASTARALAAVVARKFEEHVERSPPTSMTTIARMGRTAFGADLSAPIWKLTERLRGVMAEFPRDPVLQSLANCSAEQRAALAKALTPIIEWLDEIQQRVSAKDSQ